MAEGTYEYECMRAELLGIEKPSYEEFQKKQEESKVVQEEELDTENLKEAETQNESMKNISGGLDELNNILQVTQRKLNRFKASCGSLTNMLKFKIGGSGDSASQEPTAEEQQKSTENSELVNEVSKNDETDQASQNGTPRKSDLTKALDNHVDKLDAMIEKAENAQYSMEHQRKQMKKFLN